MPLKHGPRNDRLLAASLVLFIVVISTVSLR